jgi:hypothetical protein
MPVSTRALAAREAGDRRAGLLHAVASLVFAYMPLSVQAITLPALSKVWKQWAGESRAKERTLEEAKSDVLEIWAPGGWFRMTSCVPFWAAQQQQRDLSDVQKRRFQLHAAAHGDVGAVDWLGVGDDADHHKRLCVSAALGGQLPCCSGRAPTAATGTLTRAWRRWPAATWPCCSGRTPTAAPSIEGTLDAALRMRRQNIGRRRVRGAAASGFEGRDGKLCCYYCFAFCIHGGHKPARACVMHYNGEVQLGESSLANPASLLQTNSD